MSLSALAPFSLALAPVALRAAEKIAESFSLSDLIPSARRDTASGAGESAAADDSGPLAVNSDVLMAQLAQLRQDIELSVARIWERLRDRLSEAGESGAQALELDIAPSGAVTVAGGVEDPIGFEREVQRDEQLVDAFRELSAKIRLLRRLPGSDALDRGEPVELAYPAPEPQTRWRFY